MTTPLLPNSFVNFKDGQLPKGPSGSGIFVFVGVGNGAATPGVVTAVNSPNDVQRLFGVGPLAQDLVTFFLSGGSFCYAIQLASTTPGSAGAVTVGAFTGLTVSSAAGTLLADWDIRGRIVVGGALGIAQAIYSFDGGSTWGSPQVLQTGANNVVGYGNFNPGIQITPTALTYAVDPNPVGTASSQEFAVKITPPFALTSAFTAAMDTAIQDPSLFFNTFHISDIPSDVLLTAAALASYAATLAAKLDDAAVTWFKFIYLVMQTPAQTTGALAATFMRAVRAAFAHNRIQICCQSMVVKYLGGQYIMPVSAVVAARRSLLDPQNDLGIVSAGQLLAIVSFPPTGWSTSDVIALDQIQNNVTVRQIFGAAGFFFTNGWMSNPSSDYSKDAFRLIADLVANDVRTAGIAFIKMDVDPSDPAASAGPLLNVCAGPLDIRVKRKQMSKYSLTVPSGQDVLTTSTLIIEVSIKPMASASWIQFNVGFQSPFAGK
jgi:hypothetical protein